LGLQFSVRGKDDGGIKLLGRLAHRITHPNRAKGQGKLSGPFIARSGECENLTTLVFRYLADNVRGRPEEGTLEMASS
jgi:hypothetical protein